MSFFFPQQLSRRSFVKRLPPLSLVTFLSLSGLSNKSFVATAHAAEINPKHDVETLNTALIIEHQLIGAYQVSADTGLLKQPSLNIELLFQSHHKTHRDTLISAIQKLGGTAIEAKPSQEYDKELNISQMKSESDLLELALKLELGAANAYVNVIPSFEDHEFAKAAGRILADEVMHWTGLASTLGQPLPANALFFGS